MTKSWKRLSILSSAALAFALTPFAFADDPETPAQNAPAAQAETPAQDAPADQAQDDGPKLEIDEGPDDATTDEEFKKSLETLAEKQLGDAGKATTAEELINLATELKLSANNLVDLTKVVSLCNKAEQMGLDDENKEFVNNLKLSARLDRGLAVSQLFLNPDLPLDQLPRGWESLRNNAIGDLTTALAETPDMPIANLSLGRLYMLADKPEEAKKSLDLAINGEDAEDEVKVLALMFRALLENEPNKALPYVEQAIGIEPNAEPRLYSQYSAYLELAGRTDEAIKQIDRAIELAPDIPDYKKAKAILLAKVDRVDEARALFDEATKDAGSNIQLMVEKGEFLASIDDYDGALALYSSLIEKYDGPGLYFLRGAIYAQMKNFDKAIADANQALRRDANLLPALRLKGLVYVQMEKYEDAVRVFTQLKAKATDEGGKLEATTQIAYAISKQGKYKTASGILKKELEKKPDNVDILRSLADMELQFGHWGEADKLYAKLMELQPKDSGILNNYSWLLSTCPDEQYRDGKRALEYGKLAAEETLYAAPHILSTLAAAYAENGDFDSAREWSQKAVELGEKQRHDSLDSLKKELASYQENKPWRETEDVMKEVDESEPAENAVPAQEAQPAPAENAAPAQDAQPAAPAQN